MMGGLTHEKNCLLSNRAFIFVQCAHVADSTLFSVPLSWFFIAERQRQVLDPIAIKENSCNFLVLDGASCLVNTITPDKIFIKSLRPRDKFF